MPHGGAARPLAGCCCCPAPPAPALPIPPLSPAWGEQAPGGRAGLLAGAVGHRASPPCQLPTLAAPATGNDKLPAAPGTVGSPRKGAGSAFASASRSSRAKPGAYTGTSAASFRPPAPRCPVLMLAGPAAAASLMALPDPSPLKCQLPRHFKGCRLREAEGSNLAGSAGEEAL